MAQRDSKLTAEIAEQTFKDALSMRTIALVTLLFLPGTYISVSFANDLSTVEKRWLTLHLAVFF